MFLGLRTVVYQVQDLERAKGWYGRVLELEPYFDQPFYVGFRVGGYELGLVPKPEAAPQREPSGTAYWGVKDARDAYGKLLDLGATPDELVEDVGEGILIGSVHDPFGNVLGVIENPNFQMVADRS